jgi:hypothetical protein
LLRQFNQPIASELTDLDEKLSLQIAEMKEIREAIKAGKEVASGLDQVIQSLDSAEGWGAWDLLGGGLISTALKHSRIDEARSGVQYVQAKMSQFRRELADVQKVNDLTIDVSGFETFADYFYDGLIIDWIVQSRIVDSLEQSRQAKELIDKTILHLEKLYKAAQRKMNDLQEKRVQVIERP